MMASYEPDRSDGLSRRIAAPRTWLPIALAAVLVLVLLVLIASFGDDEETLVDAGFGNGVADGVIVDVPAGPTLFAGELPVSPGTSLTYAVNDPGSTARVDFNLEGPWSFDDNETGAILRTTYLDPAEAPLADAFTGATSVVLYEWESAAAPDEYIYQALDESSLKVFGRSDESAVKVMLEGTSRMLLFPMSTGNTWQDSYVEVSGDEQRDVSATSTVLAYDEIDLPAGTYDAFLLQTRVVAVEDDGATDVIVYTWFTPGIGRVAEIVSLPGEEDEVFTVAAAFFRLAAFEDGA